MGIRTSAFILTAVMAISGHNSFGQEGTHPEFIDGDNQFFKTIATVPILKFHLDYCRKKFGKDFTPSPSFETHCANGKTCNFRCQSEKHQRLDRTSTKRLDDMWAAALEANRTKLPSRRVPEFRISELIEPQREKWLKKAGVVQCPSDTTLVGIQLPQASGNYSRVGSTVFYSCQTADFAIGG